MREAFLWYFDRSPLAADAFGNEVADAIDCLEETAADWPKDDDGVHFYSPSNLAERSNSEMNAPTISACALLAW